MNPILAMLAAIAGFAIPFAFGRTYRQLLVIAAAGVGLGLIVVFLLPHARLVAGSILRFDEAGRILIWATLFGSAGRTLGIKFRKPGVKYTPICEFAAIGLFVLAMAFASHLLVPTRPIACPAVEGASAAARNAALQACLAKGGVAG